jgi:hypothetical protein
MEQPIRARGVSERDRPDVARRRLQWMAYQTASDARRLCGKLRRGRDSDGAEGRRRRGRTSCSHPERVVG